MQDAAVIPLLSSCAADRTRQSPSLRVLAAVAGALLLHGVLLLGNGTGAASSTPLQSHAVTVRFIEASAQQPTTSVLEPSNSVPAANLGKRAPDPSSTSPVRPPIDGTPAKVGRPEPRERPIVSGSAQPVGPVAPASRELSAERSPQSLLDAPDYVLASLLNVRPRPLEDIEPKYPDGVDQRTGKVVLRLLIGDTGHVDDVAVVRATPPGLFDASAIEAFAKARFSPGLTGGVAVKSQMTVEVDFVPLNRLSRISGRSY